MYTYMYMYMYMYMYTYMYMYMYTYTYMYMYMSIYSKQNKYLSCITGYPTLQYSIQLRWPHQNNVSCVTPNITLAHFHSEHHLA